LHDDSGHEADREGAAGARRISTGHLIAAAAYATIQRAAQELLDGELGTFRGALPVAELQAAMA